MTKPDEDGRDPAELLPLLAGLARPPLPPQVAARLDAAIARAVAERVESDEGRAVKAPQRPSYAPRRRRLPVLALGSAAACVVLVLVVVFALRSVRSDGSGSANTAAGAANQAAVSTAPVTDPALLSWADTALQNRSSPLVAHNNGQAQPNLSTFGPPGSGGSTSTADPAADCLSATALTQAGIAQQQLLSSASGRYHGQPAILLAYPNGTGGSNALVVVFAAPCRGVDSVVLASGVVPRP